MTKNKKIIIVFVVIGGLFIGLWVGLGSDIKCRLIYGKNICNFYKMMDIMACDHPDDTDFNKAMQLCRDMENVPKKDSCFEYIVEVISFWDYEKAKQACDEIVGYSLVHDKDRCYQKIQISREERVAESTVVAFMEARIQRDQELALSWLTINGSGQYLSRSDLPLTGLSNPHFADFEILEKEKLDSTQFRFKVRIYEEYTGQGGAGYFDETIIVIKEEEKYMIDSLEERSEFKTIIDNANPCAVCINGCDTCPEGCEECLIGIEKKIKDPNLKWYYSPDM